MNKLLSSLLAFLALTSVFLTHTADAQYSDQYRHHSPSPELFAFELGFGYYIPNVGNEAFSTVFGDDYGLAIRSELDILPLRIPYVGRVGIGLQFGWSEHSAGGCLDITCSQRATEETVMTLFPLGAMAVLRIDVLAREFDLPFLFTGKLGLDAVVYDINSGANDDANGISLGLKWALQFGLELDFISPRRANALDDDWGINHTNLFVEMYGSTASSQLSVGTSLSWLVGLGLAF